MDEECLRPGEPTDKSFLAKMNENLSSHDHYISHRKAGKELQKSMSREVRFKFSSVWGRRRISVTTVYRLHKTSFRGLENRLNMHNP
jgi:hypothetical protein